jgi:hypothetical protein
MESTRAQEVENVVVQASV